MNPIVQVDDVSLSYDRKRVLSNIFLSLESGHLYGVIGPNGAGKSSLFKVILGLLEPSNGKTKIWGQDINANRQRIAYVPQKDEVDWSFPATVMDVVMMGRYPYKSLFSRLNKADKALAYQALQKLGIEELAHRQIGALSGGQQQRVFLARALCQEAELFFLDEPFVGVDITTEQKIITLLQELVAEGKTVLVIHHDLSTAEDYFDQVILLNQRLITYGATAEVLTRENIAITYASQASIWQEIGIIDHERGS